MSESAFPHTNHPYFIIVNTVCGYLSVDFGWTTFAPDDEAAMKKKQESELLNGRLAMIAVGGIVTQSVLADKGFPYV